MKQTRWGIIGPGAIAHNFADGLKQAPAGKLVAIASRNKDRRVSFGDGYDIAPEKRHEEYEHIFNDTDVDAVYVSTPHPFHAEISIKAMRAGKNVLCEKPAGINAAQVIAMTEVAAQERVFFMEALMYRCHPQIARMIDIIRSGEIGNIRHVRANLGFSADVDPGSRLFDRELAGGAILDVGGYPISMARLIAGAATGKPFENPDSVKAVGKIGITGVDEESYALLHFPGGMTAQCAVAISQDMDSGAWISGSSGQIYLSNPWTPGRNAGPSDATLTITTDAGVRTEDIKRAEHLFAFEAEVASRAITEGSVEAPAPAMSWDDSIGNADALDRWREQIGYVFTSDDAANNRIVPAILPAGLPQIPRRRIDGVERLMSSLILGCDNKNHFEDGAIVWDAFMAAGGNAFDTAFVYGGGRHEAALGEWIAARGVARDIVVIAKGAHTPYCTPRNIEAQLAMSLDRLRLDHVPIYIMHRDNPDVPVGEFVDTLNSLHDAGRIGIFGGSNWSVSRFNEANAYARVNGLEPLRILNNNLSLAVMERPVWDGCMTSNSPETLAFLRENATIHFSWSSQARGYFFDEELRTQLPVEFGPESCFGSDRNAERRKRAEALAAEMGVSTPSIATAWVLAQEFPSFALIGPRSPGEIASTLPALDIELTSRDVAWLNLESEIR